MSKRIHISKNDFTKKLYALLLSRTEFSLLSNTPLKTIENWGNKSGKYITRVPIWVESFINLIEEGKTLSNSNCNTSSSAKYSCRDFLTYSEFKSLIKIAELKGIAEFCSIVNLPTQTPVNWKNSDKTPPWVEAFLILYIKNRNLLQITSSQSRINLIDSNTLQLLL